MNSRVLAIYAADTVQRRSKILQDVLLQYQDADAEIIKQALALFSSDLAELRRIANGPELER